MLDCVAVVGATGAVGTIIRQLLEERRFPCRAVKFVASARSAGRPLAYAGREILVEELQGRSSTGWTWPSAARPTRWPATSSPTPSAAAAW